MRIQVPALFETSECDIKPKHDPTGRSSSMPLLDLILSCMNHPRSSETLKPPQPPTHKTSRNSSSIGHGDYSTAIFKLMERFQMNYQSSPSMSSPDFTLRNPKTSPFGSSSQVIHQQFQIQPLLPVACRPPRRLPRHQRPHGLQPSPGGAPQHGEETRIRVGTAGLLVTPGGVEVVVEVQHLRAAAAALQNE